MRRESKNDDLECEVVLPSDWINFALRKVDLLDERLRVLEAEARARELIDRKRKRDEEIRMLKASISVKKCELTIFLLTLMISIVSFLKNCF